MVAVRSKSPKPAAAPIRPIRCAVYCRKSNTEGLDGDFSSLVTQKEACAAFVLSQASQGWVLIEEDYSDGGYSGANTDRPGFQRLLGDIEAGKVDVVMVHKIDRLSRSLRDFAHLMDFFERHGVSFVSASQQFNTSTSMGKLTLNLLMSFAEFEREVTRERILDKVAAAKKRGKHTGGIPILGYKTVDKKLVVVEDEAKLVRRIFEGFLQIGSTTKLAAELNAAGHRTKSWPTVTGKVYGGHEWNKSHIYRLLSNPLYVGLVQHRDQTYPGEHPAIITRETWNQARATLAEHHRVRANRSRSRTEALLRGVIRCAHCNCAMGSTYTKKNGRVYRFYLCVQASKKGYTTCPVKSVAAGAIEEAVMQQLRVVLRTPEIITRTYREAKTLEAEEIDRLRSEKIKLSKAGGDDDLRLAQVEADLRALAANPITEREVIEALCKVDNVWSELFPGERARIVQLLVSRVDVRPDSLELRLRADGLRSLLSELQAGTTEAPA